MSQPSAGRARLFGALKIVFAVLLLGWVASTLPWRDELVLKYGEQGKQELSVTGVIEGVWREDAVSFRVDPDAELVARWPDELRGAQAAGTALPVTRALAKQEGFSWRPGMPRVFRGIEGSALALAMLLVVLGTVCGTTRWWRILNLAACPSGWWNTFRLSYLGMFFNLVVPGLTGGDVPKAIFVVREHPERRADALMTVVLDRMIGLWALIGLATGAILANPGKLDDLRIPVTGAFVIATSGMTVVLSSRVRGWFRLDKLIPRLPLGEKIVQLETAARVFSGKPREVVLALTLSVFNHLAVIGSAYVLGHGFGDALGYTSYISIVSVGNVISSLPISPAGWGIGELAYRELFELAGSAGAIGVAVSVSYRLCTVALGLAGGLFLLTRGPGAVRESVREAERAIQEAS